MGMGGVQGKSLVQVQQLRIGPSCGCWGDFLTVPQQPISQHLAMGFISGHTHGFKELSEHWQTHGFKEWPEHIVHLYFSKSVTLVLLTMKSILPISGLL